MKKVLTVLLILIFVNLKSQENEKFTISHISPKKDTLYLINNKLGKMIKLSWNDTILNKPIFVFVSDEELIKIKKNGRTFKK